MAPGTPPRSPSPSPITPPVANDDTASTNEDTPVTIAVLTNDTDADTDPLTIVGATDGYSGTTAVNTDGTITYTPGADFHGTDEFTYVIDDGHGRFSYATVTVTVNQVNDAPVATAGSLSTTEGTSGSGTLAATDVDGDALTYSIVDQTAAHGTVTITNAATGAYTYAPDPDYNGPASFTFKASDGTTDSNTATVTITVTEVNDAPFAVNDTLTAVSEDATAFSISLSSLLANDTPGPANESGQSLTIIGISNVVGGTAVIVGSTVVFTPTPNYNGPAGFDYTVQDNGTTNGAADPKTATGHVSFTITPVNDPPVANADSASTGMNTAVYLNVLSNDTDIDGDTLTITSVPSSGAGAPTRGVVTFTGSGVTYTPATGFTGTDSFTYTISDGNGGTSAATVTITVYIVITAPGPD